MERQTLVFVTERETKNTVRFQEEASGKPPVGYRTFSCRACRLRFNQRTGSPFNDLQFPTDVRVARRPLASALQARISRSR